MYLIPVGQNPTGAVSMFFLRIIPKLTCPQRLWLLTGRRKYMGFASNLVKYHSWLKATPNFSADIIIVEDDPYYFLQEGSYIPPSERSRKPKESVLDDEGYISSLSPSFLSCVYLEIPSIIWFVVQIWLPRTSGPTWHLFQSKPYLACLSYILLHLLITDYCSGMSPRLVYMQPNFCWKTKEAGRNFHPGALWIWTGL